MKMLRCVVQPHKIEDLRQALEEIDIHGLTVYEVKGHGRQKGHKEVYRGSEYHVSFMPKMMAEIALGDEQVETAIEKIIGAVQTGQIGDGKIFVFPLDQVVRVRTKERGEDAL